MSTQYSCFQCGVDLPNGEDAETFLFPEHELETKMPVCDSCYNLLITNQKKSEV